MGDLLSSISVLLVFLTFLLNSIEQRVDEMLSARVPLKNLQSERKQFMSEIRALLFLRTLPVTFIFGIVFYTMLPKTVDILMHSEFSWWTFDALSTILVFLELGLLGLMLYAGYRSCALIGKLFSE